MDDSLHIRAAENGYIVTYWCWIAETNRDLVFTTQEEMIAFMQSYFDDAVTACQESLSDGNEGD